MRTHHNRENVNHFVRPLQSEESSRLVMQTVLNQNNKRNTELPKWNLKTFINYLKTLTFQEKCVQQRTLLPNNIRSLTCIITSNFTLVVETSVLCSDIPRIRNAVMILSWAGNQSSFISPPYIKHFPWNQTNYCGEVQSWPSTHSIKLIISRGRW